jgi:hypothetical protein
MLILTKRMRRKQGLTGRVIDSHVSNGGTAGNAKSSITGSLLECFKYLHVALEYS